MKKILALFVMLSFLAGTAGISMADTSTSKTVHPKAHTTTKKKTTKKATKKTAKKTTKKKSTATT